MHVRAETTIVVINRIPGLIPSEIEFKKQIHEISIVGHDNLVPNTGLCFSRKGIFYPYMAGGSVFAQLHGEFDSMIFQLSF